MVGAPNCFKSCLSYPVPCPSYRNPNTQASWHPWEPSHSNGDILTYFELGSHWSYNQSFWHLNSSWDNDLSLHSWYLTCPVSPCLLQLQYLWISQFLKTLAGDSEQLQERYACCLPIKKKVSSIKAVLEVCLYTLEDGKAKVKTLKGHLGWRDFVHPHLAMWMQLPL